MTTELLSEATRAVTHIVLHCFTYVQSFLSYCELLALALVMPKMDRIPILIDALSVNGPKKIKNASD